MLAGLAAARGVGALARPAAALVVAAAGRLGELNPQWREGLACLGEDEGRQDGSDQQPAFRAHRNSRVWFRHAAIRRFPA
ncbi:hypothetical protein [Bosea minatitlanensis]|uniref:Secreted protein n=1 Tax=Bosea minatitlanensis TaxID=128782 RepID=A0ABW0F701_9HYPH